ncbi:sodium channel protein Nach-like [Planococcus citri]|uniref:sodium channel protein Nach-like n=1 Tax=Planococcus citri TaxID=170843 RepID=UPI0031FA3B23
MWTPRLVLILAMKKARRKPTSFIKKFINEGIKFLKIFVSATSIHGLIHFTGPRIHLIERMLWLISFVLCLYGATILSLSTWKRYQETPTVISMERNWKDWNTSFPSITICPTEKYDELALQELIDTEFKNYTNKEEISNFLIHLANATYFTFINVPEIGTNIVPPSRYIEFIYRIRFNLRYVLSNSNMELFNISTLDLTITELGICYAYNSRVAIYNSYSYWLSKNWTILSSDKLIERNPLDGDMFGQIMNMSSGYYGFIHSPMEAPDIAAYMLFSPSYVFKSIELTALSTYSTSKVKDLNIEQRKCRFFNESNLITSPVYAYRLCRNECRMKLAHKLCGCIPHFYRPSYQYKICDVKGMHCLGQYSELLVKLKDSLTNNKIQCPCHLPCEYTIYVVETEENMEWPFGTYIKWSLSKYPRMRLKRDILFGFSDVLVSVGGTFGLFLGSSVLSFMEILYFFTLRLYLYIMRQS